ncbi:MAG TPA: nitroreductase family protein [Anaerolineaceae bacterium]|nr:nitroreductase family protein [Anaerolineaceae bacterium]
MIADLVRKNRSYRRFYQDEAIDMATLRELVDLARLSPSSRNAQPLKYILSCDRETNAKIFSTLTWAAFLKDWPGPAEGERPSAYIIVLNDWEITPSVFCDHGIAAQSILLGAVERGLGGCILSNVHKRHLAQEFKLTDRYEILLVIALGKPREEVAIEPLPADGDTKYWRDANDGHHVPKRSLDEIILQV